MLPIQRELNDKEMALRIIQAMDNRVGLATIIKRLQAIDSMINSIAELVRGGVIDEERAVAWLLSVVKSYVNLYEPATPGEQPSASQDGPG